MGEILIAQMARGGEDQKSDYNIRRGHKKRDKNSDSCKDDTRAAEWRVNSSENIGTFNI